MFILYLLCWIMIILAVILSGYAISVQYKKNCVITTPYQWCYNDWTCNINGEPVNVSQKVLFNVDPNTPNVTTSCQPINESNLHNFPYVDPTGNTVIGDPGNEINTYGESENYPLCGVNNDYSKCPNYTVGDVYFKACTGSTASSYYDLARTYYVPK